MRLREKALGGDSRALDRLLALAQSHNDEMTDTGVTKPLAADDREIFEAHNKRVRQATSVPRNKSENGGANSEDEKEPNSE